MRILLAQTPIEIGQEWQLKPGVGIGSAKMFETPAVFISVILKNVYVIAGVLLLVLLIFGGISIIMAAGSGDAKKTAEGQKAVTAALTGFLIIFASYWIIQIVQFLTGIKILNPII